MSVKPYQHSFIELALRYQVLCFGEFTLKSGRVSPYFFNAGKFCSGAALAALGRCYAQAIIDSDLEFDMIFGPAYKGIPLAAAVTVALADHHGRDVPYAFNRKEAKSHGEGGLLVGAPLQGKRVLIVDDVITAGTAIREVVQILQAENAVVAGVVIGLDRQEKGTGEQSAVQSISEQFQIEAVSVITLQSIMDFLGQSAELKPHLQKVQQYRQQYGI